MKARRSRRRAVRKSRHAGAGRATALAPAGLVPAAVVLTAVLLGGIALVAKMVSPAGSLTHVARLTWEFLDFFVGVFTLLSLTTTVVVGLLATDRIVLTPRLRVSTQLAHRAAAVAALGFLLIHIVVKVGEAHASLVSTVVPFAGGAGFAVGLGVIAAYLMALAAVTGLVRGRFATSGRPWMWRVLHATAYACWAFALAHGLSAGRPAKTWVLWGYGVCAAAVALVLAMRALHALGAGRSARRAQPSLLAYEPGLANEQLTAELSALSAAPAPPPTSAGPVRPGVPRPNRTPAAASRVRPAAPAQAGTETRAAPAAAATAVTAAAVIPGSTTAPGPRTATVTAPRPARTTAAPGWSGTQHPPAATPPPGGGHGGASAWDTGAHAFPSWDTTTGGIPAYGTGPAPLSPWETPVRGVPVYDAAAHGMTAYGTALPDARAQGTVADTPPSGTPVYGTAVPGPHTVPAYRGQAHAPASPYGGVPGPAPYPGYAVPLHETPAHGIPVHGGGPQGAFTQDGGAPIGPLQWLHHGTTW